MLKAYAVAVALSTTTPVTTSSEVEAQPVKNNTQQTQLQKGYKRGGGLIFPTASASVKKGYKRGGGLIFPN